MTPLQKSPRALAGADAGEDGSWYYTTTSPCSRQHFPRCQLHDLRIIDALPLACPLARPNPLTSLSKLQATAWLNLGSVDDLDQQEAGLVQLAKYETCADCVTSGRMNKAARRLRRSATPPAPAYRPRLDSPRSSSPVSVTSRRVRR
jgi:hypothetical protein